MTTEIFGRIQKKVIENGNTKGKDWTRSVFTINEKNYATFDDNIRHDFQEGDEVKITLEQNGKYWNMKSMEKVQPQASNAQNNPMEFHLSPEACRYDALDIALKHLAFIGTKPTTEQVIAMADLYLSYITGKEKKEDEKK